MHLTVAVLLRVIMRRGGVSPWIATSTAALLAFFGAGDDNILVAFQIGLVGSLVFGLTQLLLADHDGPIDRAQRRLGLGCARVSPGCCARASAVPMTIVVGIAMLLRRGWRIALAAHRATGHCVLTVGPALSAEPQHLRKADARNTDGLHHPQPSDDVRIIGSGPVGRCGSCDDARPGRRPDVGTSPSQPRSAPPRQRHLRHCSRAPCCSSSSPASAGPALPAATVPSADESRYIHVTAALAVPGTGSRRVRSYVAGDRAAGPHDAAHRHPRQHRGVCRPDGPVRPVQSRLQTSAQLAVPRSAVADQVPRWVRPSPVLAPEVTIGWLLDAAAAGRLPEPGPITPEFADKIELTLSLVPPDKGTSTNRCRVIREPASADTPQRRFHKRDRWRCLPLPAHRTRCVETLVAPCRYSLVTVVDRLTIDVSPTGGGHDVVPVTYETRLTGDV